MENLANSDFGLKKTRGQFFTKKDSWIYSDIEELINSNYFSIVMDPFVGEGDLLNSHLFEKNYSKVGLDIDKNLLQKLKKELEFNLKENDSLIEIPHYKDSLIITNPPYFSRVSASTKKNHDVLKYLLSNNYHDIYMISIEKALKSSRFSIFIIPETFLFLKNNPFIKKVVSINIIEENMFTDTEIPVVSVIFDSEKNSDDFKIFKNGSFVFFYKNLCDIQKRFEKSSKNLISFNKANGQFFLRAIDSSNPKKRILLERTNSIKKNKLKIKNSTRSLTLVHINLDLDNKDISLIVKEFNKELSFLRKNTHDLILSPFKGNNFDGIRRRRLDYKTARNILNKILKDKKYVEIK